MTPVEKSLLSLEGLSVGDAFGEQMFFQPPFSSGDRTLPPGPWPWTDDTQMAISIVEVLREHGRIEQDALAQAFAERFVREPHRGYGLGAMGLLREFSRGGDLTCPDGVMLEDLLYLADRWQGTTLETIGAADADGDGKVTFPDFAILSEDWLMP